MQQVYEFAGFPTATQPFIKPLWLDTTTNQLYAWDGAQYRSSTQSVQSGPLSVYAGDYGEDYHGLFIDRSEPANLTSVSYHDNFEFNVGVDNGESALVSRGVGMHQTSRTLRARSREIIPSTTLSARLITASASSRPGLSRMSRTMR